MLLCHLWSKMSSFRIFTCHMIQSLYPVPPQTPYTQVQPRLLLNSQHCAFKKLTPESVGLGASPAVSLGALVFVCCPTVYILLPSEPWVQSQQLVPPCLSPCLTMTEENRSRCEAWRVSKTSQSWSRISTDTCTLRWSRTEMWPLEGITTLLLPTPCGTTWLAGGSGPSSTTMRKILK